MVAVLDPDTLADTFYEGSYHWSPDDLSAYLVTGDGAIRVGPQSLALPDDLSAWGSYLVAVNGDRITPDTTSAVHFTRFEYAPGGEGPVVFTGILQSFGVTQVLIRVGDTTESAAFQAAVNLAQGTVTGNSYGTGARVDDVALIAQGDGSYRLAVSGIVSGVETYRVVVYPLDDAGNIVFAGDGVDALRIAGPFAFETLDDDSLVRMGSDWFSGGDSAASISVPADPVAVGDNAFDGLTQGIWVTSLKKARLKAGVGFGLPVAVNGILLEGLSGTFTLAENAAQGASAGALAGVSAGSTLTLLDNAGGRVALDGSNIVAGPTALNYERFTSHDFTVRETNPNALNSPRDTVLTLTVSDVFDATQQTFPSDSASPWSVYGGTGTVTRQTDDASEPQHLEFTTTTAGARTDYLRTVSVDPLSAVGNAVVVRCKRDANLSVLDVHARAAGASTSKVYTTNMGVSQIPAGRWFDLVLPFAYFNLPAGASPENFAQPDQLRFRITPTSGQNTTFEVADIRFINADQTPRVCFQFDDALVSTYTEAFPILEAAGFTGSVAAEYANMGGTNRMSVAQLDELYAAGWEVLGHHNVGIPGMTEAVARSHFEGARDFMAGRGYTRGTSHWVWPGGSRNATVDAWAADYYRTRRGTLPMATVASKDFFDPYDVSIFYITSGKTLAQVQAHLDKVAAYGGAAIIVFHDLVNSKVAAEDWLISDFDALVSYAAGLGLAGTGFDYLFGRNP